MDIRRNTTRLGPVVGLTIVLGPAVGQAKPSVAPMHRIDEISIRGEAYVRREIRASTAGRPAQGGVALDLTERGILLTWEGRRQRAGRTGVYTQAFDGAGHRLGGERSVFAVEGRVQRAPAVVGGRTPVFAWESFDGLRDGAVVRLRRADGTPVRLGRDAPTVPCRQVTLLRTASGGVVAGYVRLRAVGRPEVWIERWTAGLRPVGRPRRITRHGALPTLAGMPRGFVLAWARRDERGEACGLGLQRFDPDGAPRGAVVRVSDGAADGCIEPAVAALPGGGLVLVWHQRSTAGQFYDVRAQCFDAALRPRGRPWTAAVAGERLSGACVAASAYRGGRVCISWTRGEGDGSSQDVWARIYTVAGKALGGAFVVTGRRRGNQEFTAASGRRRIAFGGDGRLAFAWSGDGGFGDPRAAHLTLLVPAAHESVARVRDARPEQIAPLRPETLATPTGVARPHDPPVFLEHVPQETGAPSPASASDPGFVAITHTGWVPPDPRIAVGPRHIVQVVNGGIAYFEKGGSRNHFEPLAGSLGFWRSLGATGFVFDPRVVFDGYTGRFIAVAAEYDSRNGLGLFCVAVSDDDDPNGKWHKWRIDVTTMARGPFVDYPHLGVDRDAIYITSNNFGNPDNHTVMMLPKAPMLTGGNPLPRKVLRDSTSFSGAMCAQRGDVPGGGIMVRAGRSGQIEIQSFRDPLTTPVRTTAVVTVPGFANPPRVPQKGTTSTLWAVDARITQTAVRGKRVYAIHTIGVGGRALARWYEFDLRDWPVSGSPRLVQSGNIDAGAGVHTFLPGIGVDIYGNICACFARSGSAEFPSIGRAFHAAGDAAGTMNHRERSVTSTTGYTGDRWGDYSSVVLDPRDQATFWYSHEYATSATTWNTWVGRVRVQRPTLTESAGQLSAVTGGVVTLQLDNPAYAGRPYLMVCGWSGRSPGIRLPDPPQIVNLDLNLDALTDILVANLNSPVFSNFAGSLDGGGRARAVFRMPAVPGLIGREILFAYGQDGSRFDFASETVGVRLTR